MILVITDKQGGMIGFKSKRGSSPTLHNHNNSKRRKKRKKKN